MKNSYNILHILFINRQSRISACLKKSNDFIKCAFSTYVFYEGSVTHYGMDIEIGEFKQALKHFSFVTFKGSFILTDFDQSLQFIFRHHDSF